MPLTQFDPPGFAPDFSDATKKLWSDQLSTWIDREIGKLDAIYQAYFFNELNHPEAAAGAVVAITWEGFPRQWILKFPHDNVKKWQESEKLYKTQDGTVFRNQDEYLEWRSVYQNGKLIKATFTCEGPEYWSFMAEQEPDTLLNLYRKYADPSVQLSDLFVTQGGQKLYNGSNKWNTTNGIIHLTQPNNTLQAEVNLAVRAVVLRKNQQGQLILDPVELTNCSGFGDANRFSDPKIGSSVNSLVAGGTSVTLNNPIGLYIQKLSSAGIQLPAGTQLSDFWKIIRGDGNNGMILRAEFSAPAGSNIDLSTIKIGGVPLQFGAQLAEQIQMVIYGKGFKFGAGAVPAPESCPPQTETLIAAAVTTGHRKIGSTRKFSGEAKLFNND